MLYVRPIDGYWSVEVTWDFKDTRAWREFLRVSWSFRSSKGFRLSFRSKFFDSGAKFSAGPPANELMFGFLIGYLFKLSRLRCWLLSWPCDNKIESFFYFSPVNAVLPSNPASYDEGTSISILLLLARDMPPFSSVWADIYYSFASWGSAAWDTRTSNPAALFTPETLPSALA